MTNKTENQFIKSLKDLELNDKGVSELEYILKDHKKEIINNILIKIKELNDPKLESKFMIFLTINSLKMN